MVNRLMNRCVSRITATNSDLTAGALPQHEARCRDVLPWHAARCRDVLARPIVIGSHSAFCRPVHYVGSHKGVP